MTKTSPLTPNVRRLFVEFMSAVQIDQAKKTPGDGELFLKVVHRISTPELWRADTNAAIEITIKAVEALRAAPDASFKDDEEAAGAILERINERRAQQRKDKPWP